MNAASLILATIGLIVPATFAAILNAGAETGEGSPSSSTWRCCRSAWPVLLLTCMRRRPTSTSRRRRPRPPVSATGRRRRVERAALARGAHRLRRRPDGRVRDPGGTCLDPMVEAVGINKFFVGIILIPLIGNLAEHVVGITLAYKNKMDFSLVTSPARPPRSPSPRRCWSSSAAGRQRADPGLRRRWRWWQSGSAR